jgi:hypothetical protein
VAGGGPDGPATGALARGVGAAGVAGALGAGAPAAGWAAALVLHAASRTADAPAIRT